MSIQLFFFVFTLVSLTLHATSASATTATSTPFNSLLLQQQQQSSVTVIRCCQHTLKQQQQQSLNKQRVHINSVETDINHEPDSEAAIEWLSDNGSSRDELNGELMLSAAESAPTASINSSPSSSSSTSSRFDHFRAFVSGLLDPSQSIRSFTMDRDEFDIRRWLCEAIRPSRTNVDPELRKSSQVPRVARSRGADCEYNAGVLPDLSMIGQINDIPQVENAIRRLEFLTDFRPWNEIETQVCKQLKHRLKQLQQTNHSHRKQQRQPSTAQSHSRSQTRQTTQTQSHTQQASLTRVAQQHQSHTQQRRQQDSSSQRHSSA